MYLKSGDTVQFIALYNGILLSNESQNVLNEISQTRKSTYSLYLCKILGTANYSDGKITGLIEI